MRIKRFVPQVKKEWNEKIIEYLNSYNSPTDDITSVLERYICEYTKSKYSLCVSSGTAGILLSLSCLDKGKVLLPNYGYPAALNCCKYLGLTPVFLPMKRETISIDPDRIKEFIDKDVVALVHVETNGRVSSDIEKIKGICKKNSIIFIEDSAPSILQSFNGKNAGTFGDIGVFSFSHTKPICCCEGGAIVTNTKELYEKLKALRSTDDYNSLNGSLNFSLSPILSSYLIPQFEEIEQIKNKYTEKHNLYRKYNLRIFEDKTTNNHSSISYISKNPKKVCKKLEFYKIEYRYMHYPVFNKFLDDASKWINSKIIDIPNYPEITESEIKIIASLLGAIDK